MPISNIALPSPAAKRKPGRPRKLISAADPSREYTVGGTTSQVAGINNNADWMRLSGSVDDMDLRLGWHTKAEMDNDPFVSAALTTIALGATSRDAEVRPAPSNLFEAEGDDARAVQVAEFIRRYFGYLAQTHRNINLTAYQVLRNALKIGFSNSEIVTELRKGGVDDGKRVATRIKSKNRFNSAFVVDRQLNVLGIAGFTGDYSQYQNPYAAMTGGSGIIPVTQLGAGWELLPREKWLSVTNAPPDDDSPTGSSVLRPAFTGWRAKRDNWPLYFKSLDSTALPFLWATLPEHGAGRKVKPLVNGIPDENAAEVDLATVIYQALEQGRQGGIAVLPYGSQVHSISNPQGGDQFVGARGVFNGEITQCILLQSLATGTDRHMARAAGEVHENILGLAIRHHRRGICDNITRDVIGPAVRMNFTKEYWHLIPSLSFGEVELHDFAAWSEAMSKLNQSGLLHVSQYPFIHAILGLPQVDMEQFAHDHDHEQALIDVLGEPTVSATGQVQEAPLPKYIKQEVGKSITRPSSRKVAARVASNF